MLERWMPRGLITTALALLLATGATAAKNTIPAQAPAKNTPLTGPKAKAVPDASAPEAEAIRLAIEDMAKSFPEQFTNAPALLARLKACGDNETKLRALRREALLANPLLDFDELLIIRRRFKPGEDRTVLGKTMGMPGLNSHTHDTIISPNGKWDNEIAVLENWRKDTSGRVLYHPGDKRILCDVDLDFDASRMMFSMYGTHDQWHVFELDTSGGEPVQLTPKDIPDVGHFDSCYLPDGDIIFDSTASFQGLPCQYGSSDMACLYRMDRDTGRIRQLAFEQDSDWCPTVLNNGRVLYLRWEYPDTPHYFTRVLFHMNPDGTGQMEYYGSNSYFPNAFFFARPVPGHPTMVAGIAGGHHGISRSGRLLLIDPELGRSEADGVVQEIPGRGVKVEPMIRDRLVDGVWPQFLHPWPLNDKYLLASVKPTPNALWGLYLVDVFDNITLIAEEEGAALIEPIPLKTRPTPPLIAPRVDLERKDGVVFLVDVNRGPGLKDVPDGKVKQLRLFTYHFGYRGVGGHNAVGVESGWDIKRILGTVPVEEDGSAMFRVPANTPISVQPLDDKGRAIQLMRSWFVTMPGETVSCVGCHEPQNEATPQSMALAARAAPVDITPWRGPARGFDFRREVGPVLEKRCVGCHDGKKEDRPDFTDWTGTRVDGGKNAKSIAVFPKAYAALQPYVRRPGPESDYRLYHPMEYHAETSELVQMLERGHHGVSLDEEDWDRLNTWIDLNAPCHGAWATVHEYALASDEIEEKVRKASEGRMDLIREQRDRRLELMKLYANLEDDPEAESATFGPPPEPVTPVKFVRPRKPAPATLATAVTAADTAVGWPFDAAKAKALQLNAGGKRERVIDLGDGVELRLSRIPAGQFVMGDATAEINRPFWIGVCEVSNAQYAQFNPRHDSRYIDRAGKDHKDRGFPANLPEQPVIRVSQDEANAFCQWLSEKTGAVVALPTEAQWEWACRAGSDTAMWFGEADSDFSKFANLADVSGSKLRTTPFPTVVEINDGQQIPALVGSYEANAWGLYDAHGNVSEWTRSRDGERVVVRGGSWRDRPARSTSAFRLTYERYQRVFNVGFRVVIEEKDAVRVARASCP